MKELQDGKKKVGSDPNIHEKNYLDLFGYCFGIHIPLSQECKLDIFGIAKLM